MSDVMTAKETREATTYTIMRIMRTRIKDTRTYQITKLIMGVTVDHYWVQFTTPGTGSNSVQCDCMGFRQQNYPKFEHKHVKLAQDYWNRGEPAGARYRIHNTGQKAEIEYLGVE